MAEQPVSFETKPYQWTHWRLQVDGPVARLDMDIQEDAPFREGYELKLNSYDLGVDIELYDVVQRLRFEHPAVKAVVLSSNLHRVFCAGANIRMLGTSSHAFKVNFCKYTNETRCSIEDYSDNSGVTWLAALNGTCAGGGYELALACDEIYLVDDGSSAVSLPEVPLLGVLPGTGGLTRLVDKRKIRRDVADIFCTRAEGFKARDAVKYRLVDGSIPRSKWDDEISAAAAAAVERNGGAAPTDGVQLTPLQVEITEDGGRSYQHVSYTVDVDARVATLTINGPTEAPPTSHDALYALGDGAWALAAFRELEDALLHLRFNQMEIGLLLFHARGDAANVLAWDKAIADLRADGSWLAREIQLFQRRTLRRVDNMSRSMFALIDEGSCFSGVLLELALAADRAYMFLDDDEENAIHVGDAQAGAFSMSTGMTRLEARFYGEPERIEAALDQRGETIAAEDAEDMGLVTMALDDIDWEDEVRIAIEERASLSPDGLTGMEQNLRFVGRETCESRIYGRLSAWQNWIFQRPNAVGPSGALKLFGQPEQPEFDFKRV